LDRARKDFEAAGAKLVLIGQLTPRHAAHFRRKEKLDVTVLADNDRVSYKAAGATKGGVGQLIGPSVVAKGVMTTLRTGKMQTRTIGDPAQLGGAMVIDQDGTIVWSKMARDASDNSPPEKILAALPTAA
jgi:peroxiredoxin